MIRQASKLNKRARSQRSIPIWHFLGQNDHERSDNASLTLNLKELINCFSKCANKKEKDESYQFDANMNKALEKVAKNEMNKRKRSFIKT